MAKSKAKTVSEYLASLPADTCASIEKVLAFVRKHIPSGYEEAMNWGVISWQIPLKTLPDTYNGHPLSYIGLAAQKSFNSLYLLRVYGDKQQETKLRDGFTREGKKLDMGKSCIHFTTPDDLALGVLGELIASTPASAFVAHYKATRGAKSR